MVLNVIEAALPVRPVGGNRYATIIGSDFRMGEFLYGGFAASLVAQTALKHTEANTTSASDRHVTSVHVQFFAPITRKEIVLEVQNVSSSKATSNLRVLLSQKDAVKLTADITLTNKASNKGLTIPQIFRLAPSPPPVDLTKLNQNTDPNWIRYHIPYNAASAAIPESHWYRHLDRSGPRDPSVHEMWWCLADRESRITTSILPYTADLHLRMVYNFEPDSDFSYAALVRRAERSIDGDVRQEDLENVVMKVWPATQSIHLEILRSLPEQGVKWVFQRAEAKVMKGGKLVVEVTVCDEELEVIAVGQTVDLVIPAQSRAKDGQRGGGGAKIWKI